MIQVGKPAPDFQLEALVGEEFKQIHLADYRGKWVVFFFYPLDFTFVCPTEIREFNRRLAEFREAGAEVLGCSVDSVYAHLAWAQGDLGRIDYPLLSDITKRVSRQYEVLIEEQGTALRGLYIIDPEGILRYQLVHELNVGRSVDETLRVLKALQVGELCPVEWHPGEETLGKG